MFERDNSGEKTVIYIDKLNSFKPTDLNAAPTGEEIPIDEIVI